MHPAWEFLNQHITYAPLVMFLLLLLAGVNFPVSEDLIILTSAFIARKNQELIYHLYIAILSGVIISDHMMYWIGTLIGHGLWRKYFCKFFNPAKLEKLHSYIRKYGIFSFIICRFIPFGVRNTLFFTSGLMRLKYYLFTIFDGVAALISVSTMYYLFYQLGSSVEQPFRILGIILFVFLLSSITAGLVKFYRSWKAGRLNNPDNAQEGP